MRKKIFPVAIVALVLIGLAFSLGVPLHADAQSVGIGSPGGDVDRGGYQNISQFSGSITAGTAAVVVTASTCGPNATALPSGYHIRILSFDVNSSGAAVFQLVNSATLDGTHTVGQWYVAANTPRGKDERELGGVVNFSGGDGTSAGSVYANLSTGSGVTVTFTCRYKLVPN